jgi:hypothetical protein
VNPRTALKRQSSLHSVIRKFELAAATRDAHIWSGSGSIGYLITRCELDSFVRWVRTSGYDLESGSVNLYCQGYGVFNCDEEHDTKDGVCDCFTGLTLQDFESDDPDDVDIADWLFNFRLMHNPEWDERRND